MISIAGQSGYINRRSFLALLSKGAAAVMVGTTMIATKGCTPPDLDDYGGAPREEILSYLNRNSLIIYKTPGEINKNKTFYKLIDWATHNFAHESGNDEEKIQKRITHFGTSIPNIMQLLGETEKGRLIPVSGCWGSRRIFQILSENLGVSIELITAVDDEGRDHAGILFPDPEIDAGFIHADDVHSFLRSMRGREVPITAIPIPLKSAREMLTGIAPINTNSLRAYALDFKYRSDHGLAMYINGLATYTENTDPFISYMSKILSEKEINELIAYYKAEIEIVRAILKQNKLPSTDGHVNRYIWENYLINPSSK
ncbi:MAG: hypothetical protein FD145_660 [Candidatus Saganbacteria bacterium]|uniref:Twin-arginine translocation signal domain-containing protein n=1 Tax=Candidatus Saganbacteria bacterium TaxID=2575572 RepID=A0A833L1E2_UNCSA|nr:MAG: hypothetical protein FD145_660 [Candidatus Saganbacteria bacterium]